MTTLYGEDYKQTEVKELNPSANMGHQIWQSIPDFLATKKSDHQLDVLHWSLITVNLL